MAEHTLGARNLARADDANRWAFRPKVRSAVGRNDQYHARGSNLTPYHRFIAVPLTLGLSTISGLVASVLLATPTTYSGRDHQVHVRIPRIAADAVVDGVLDEPAWQQAAVLNGFSEFSPQDGIPAADSTQVLLWYSPTALYVGIRAYEAHGAVHAALSDRDKISADDNVQILLGTFHDQRQAYVFGVNPL